MDFNQLISEFKKQLAHLYDEREATELAFWVIEDLTGKKRTDLIVNPGQNIPGKKALQYLDELKKARPIQYILGYTWFYGEKILVSPHVLIPRSETEELILLIKNKISDQHLNILDVGTGSGCISVILKKQRPHFNIYATDNDEQILQIAKNNAIYHNTPITFIKEDILNNKYDSKLPYMDAIVSNPPYVRELEKKDMQNNVLDYEPKEALFVPDEYPLFYYENIIKKYKKLLKDKGYIFLEINENTGIKIEELLTINNFYDIRVEKDIHGKNRFIWGVYNACQT